MQYTEYCLKSLYRGYHKQSLFQKSVLTLKRPVDEQNPFTFQPQNKNNPW